MINVLLQTLKERIYTQGIDEEFKYKCYNVFLDSRFRGNDKKNVRGDRRRARRSPSEAAGLRVIEPGRHRRPGGLPSRLSLRRETPKVAPGATEETEGFRGPRSKTNGKAKRSRKGLRSRRGDKPWTGGVGY